VVLLIQVNIEELKDMGAQVEMILANKEVVQITKI
jgi:hypothetical protein